MPDYKAMYFSLFNALTDAIDLYKGSADKKRGRIP